MGNRRQGTEPWWSDLAVGGGSMGVFAIWVSQILTQPSMDAAVRSGSALTLAALATVGADAILLRPGPAPQTYEDLAGGTWVTGYPGCGKTYLVYDWIGEWARRGFGGLWASPKGAGAGVLGRFPRAAVERVDLIQPYGPRPRGLNLMRTYTGTAAEREILAGLVTEWFLREHSAAGQNMAHLLFMGPLGLLEWAAVAQEQVTPLELYLLFHREGFRRQVLAAASPLVADAFAMAEADTLDRVARLVARAVASESLMVTIG